jgi:phage tail sheath gpL-like
MAIEVAAPVVEFLSFDRTTTGVKATGSVTITGVGTDGDTVTISDSTHILTFELDNNSVSAGANTRVAIGGSADATADNLMNAINASGLDIVATDGGTGVVTLTAKFKGTQGNETVTKVGASVAVTGMTGGTNDALTVGLNDTVGTPEFTLTRFKDGRIEFVDVKGTLQRVHSDNEMVARLFAALKGVVAA